jgi:hypothetical protein
MLLPMFGACFLIFGCQNSQTIWSAESRSPDGKVVATARAIARNQGLSIISGTDTDVHLRWASGSRGDVSILELADATDAPVNTQVEMNWLSPDHLELTFKGNQTIEFQAIKWAGINISVRHLSSQTSNSSPLQQ